MRDEGRMYGKKNDNTIIQLFKSNNRHCVMQRSDKYIDAWFLSSVTRSDVIQRDTTYQIVRRATPLA